MPLIYTYVYKMHVPQVRCFRLFMRSMPWEEKNNHYCWPSEIANCYFQGHRHKIRDQIMSLDFRNCNRLCTWLLLDLSTGIDTCYSVSWPWWRGICESPKCITCAYWPFFALYTSSQIQQFRGDMAYVSLTRTTMIATSLPVTMWVPTILSVQTSVI